MSADPLARLATLEGVPSAFAATRDGIDALLRDRGLRRTPPERTVESLVRGAHASAALAGSVSSVEDVLAGGGDETAQDAVRITTELLSLAAVLRTRPAQALARIHALAAARTPERAGRPAGAEGAERLQGLATLIRGETSAPALLVAAVVHAEIATAEPFGSHDGLVARAAERLVLVGWGVDEKSLLVPEAGHLALRAEYESNLRGYRDGGPSGVHAWLLYAAQAYAKGAEESGLGPGRR